MTKMQQAEFIWFDGNLVHWASAQVHVLTHTLHYGVATFEGIRAYKGKNGVSAVFRLKEHIDRLFGSTTIMRMAMPFTKEEIIEAVVQTLQANKQPEAYIRPLVFIGDGVMGVHPGDNPIRVAIATWVWSTYLGKKALEKGISVKTSTFNRHHVNAMMTKGKVTGNYVNSVLAKMEAISDGYQEALMLDTSGYVSEATGENVFIVRKGKIKTTPLTTILEGITRESLITLARDLGYTVEEIPFTRDEVYIADEAFFSGTAAEVTPICEFDRRIIGEGKTGPITRHLQTEYFKIVRGENPTYAAWLHTYTV
ncbi:Branched-chain-amino-acid aminotransferase [Desulfovibrionales bacterium]